MGAIEGKVFKAGESGPLRLPEEFDIPPGTMVTIERSGLGLTIRPVGDSTTSTPADDRDRNRRNNRALAAELRAIWADAGGPPTPEKREPIEFPERPGL